MLMRILFTLLGILTIGAAISAQTATGVTTKTVPFKSHDGYEMLGKLTLPAEPPRLLVLYVQTAEGMTVDMRRPLGQGRTFDYFELYRDKLPPLKTGFFSYEGRGIRSGDKPPRFEEIDRAVFDTSTLENKVRDILSAIETVRKQPGLSKTPIFLMGASEGTLLAAQAGAAMPGEVAGLILYGVLTDNMRTNFRYIMSDGAFLVYRQNFDTDKDGKISKTEFEADPRRYRAAALGGAGFENFDKNGDGSFSGDEMKLLTKPYLDAIDKEDFAVLENWGKNSAGVSLPKDWFRNHFAQKPIWEYLKTLNIPIACFHGEQDTNTPIDGVRKLEETAKQANKTKMEFHYFEGLDHSLNIGLYFARGEMPAGHKAIFDFISRQAGQ